MGILTGYLSLSCNTYKKETYAMKYRHYKGGIYTYICDARLTTNDTLVVVYEDSKGIRWVRPRYEFFGTVEVSGVTIKRFEEMK